ncbi:MAG: hypothetical protein WC184_00540 [Acidimicrobiia bacterium]
MDLTVSLLAPCEPKQLFYWVGTLERYPQWLGIVSQVVPDQGSDGDHETAWLVDISAKVGPFTRSKRLRMVRSEYLENESAIFERVELDGRDHGEWILKAEVEREGTNGGSQLEMSLTYNGKLWGAMLEPILADEIERSRQRLLDLVTQ